jgi:hypothetical protein
METDDGLACVTRERSYTLSRIIDEFAGVHCPQLVGKPKIFLFLDHGVKKDGENETKTMVIQFSSFRCLRIKYIFKFCRKYFVCKRYFCNS